MAPVPPLLQPSAEVSYHGKGYNVKREGLAEILTPATTASKNGDPKVQTVFYNPVQQYNRDLSVLAIRAFADDCAFVKKEQQQKRQQKWRQQRGTKRKRGLDQHAEEEKESITPAEIKQQEDALPSVGAYDGRQMVNPAIEEDDAVKITKVSDLKPPEETRSEHADPLELTNHGSQPFRILDALSATGLRALRYGKELPMATSITANDLSTSATASIKLNVEHNGLSHLIQPSTSDAIDHMHHSTSAPTSGAGQYHVIDLDPYGTAAPFLDAAVRALVDGGLLCVTCTDAGVFASLGYLEKTYSQYGGLPLKGPHAHEGGVRLILHTIATAAARYGIAIEPLLSLSIDFYARIFVRIHKSPAEVKLLASKTMVVYNCDAGCGAWSVQHLAQARAKENRNGEKIYRFTSALGPTAAPECEHCGFKTHMAGPMWGGPLHNPNFIEQILDMLPSLDKEVYATTPRIEGMLTLALNESLEKKVPSIDSSKDLAGKTAESLDVPTANTVHGSSNGANSSKHEDFSSQKPRPVPRLDPSLRAQHPFFFIPSTLSGVLHCVNPSDSMMRGALMHLGYRTTRSHTKAGSIVTDAPWSVIWEIMREWVRQKSRIKDEAIRKGTAGYGIMLKDRSKTELRDAKATMTEVQKCENMEQMEQVLQALLYRLGREPEVEANGEVEEGEYENRKGQDAVAAQKISEKNIATLWPHQLNIIFDEELGKKAAAQDRRMVRYQRNPPNWGPMNKAHT
ncbi:MAG: hypothetical protein Q9217_005140 [Psora testacea]